MSKKVTRHNFKRHLFIGTGSIFIAIALIVSLLFSITAIYNSKQTEISSSQMVLERISLQVDSLYEQINIAATSIIKNTLLKQTVSELNTPGVSSPEYMDELTQKRKIQETLVNMMFSPIISNVMLYNRDYDYFYYTGVYFSDTSYIHDVLSKSRVHELLAEGPDETLYAPPHNNPWTEESRTVISVIKNFSDALTTQNTVVEIQVPYQVLADICTQTSFFGEKEFLILDSANKIVYPYKKNTFVLPKETIEGICSKIQAGTRMEYHGNYAYYAAKSNTTPFTTVLISNNKRIQRQNVSYIRTAVFTVLILLSAALTIMFIIFSIITKLLKQLIDYINTLGKDNEALLQLPNNSLDEFEVINNSFNQMLHQLKQSIAQNYELKIRESNANLAALQAQINPHFLYNTLNSISAASEIYGSRVTTKMCQDFSSMMRYITSKEQIVPIVNEITHAKNYLNLMKISNDGNLDFSIELPQELYQYEIPKLTIQPLVENCFKHGFKNCMPPWHINIVCSLDNSRITITVSDNGTGFSPKALEKLSAFRDNALKNQTFYYDDITINGLGLCNTFARMYTHFSGHFTFEIKNLSPGSQITMKGDL